MSNVSVEIDKVYARVSTAMDVDYLSSWLKEGGKPMETGFPGINTENEKDFSASVTNWFYYFMTKASITLIADDVPVGIASFWLNDSEVFAHHSMFGIIVDPNNAGKGFGTILMEYVLDFAKNILNLEFIELQVNEKNIPAINLYKKIGFRVSYIQEKFLKINDEYFNFYVMKKYL